MGNDTVFSFQGLGRRWKITTSANRKETQGRKDGRLRRRYLPREQWNRRKLSRRARTGNEQRATNNRDRAEWARASLFYQVLSDLHGHTEPLMQACSLLVKRRPASLMINEQRSKIKNSACAVRHPDNHGWSGCRGEAIGGGAGG